MTHLYPAGTPAALRELATPDLYRSNGFRLSRLSIEASPRQVRRFTQERLAELELGGGSTQEHDPVLEAVRRWRDPVRRLLDEFFWLWPDGDGADEAALIHNRAIDSHRHALEEAAILETDISTQWKASYRRWLAVLKDDRCWERLAERADSLDDPRLRAETVSAIRDALPAFLLDLHAKIAVDAYQARTHVLAMRTSRLEPKLVEAALVAATTPHVTRLRDRIERTRSAHEFPDAALERFTEDLDDLRELLGDSHPVTVGVGDVLASCTREHVLKEANAMPDDRPTVDAVRRLRRVIQRLDRAMLLPIGAHVEDQISRDLATLLYNLSAGLCLLALEESGTGRIPHTVQQEVEAFLARVEGLDAGLAAQARAELGAVLSRSPLQVSRALPPHSRVTAARCALCRRWADRTRNVHVAEGIGIGAAITVVAVPCCAVCQEKALRKGCLMSLIQLFLVVFFVYVAIDRLFLDAPHITLPWAGWTVAGLALALSFTGTIAIAARRRALRRQPEIARRLAAGHLIVG